MLAARPGQVWSDLDRQGAIVITKDGVPRRIMVPTSDATLLEDVQELVFARARKAVREMRTRSATTGVDNLTEADIEKEIAAARLARAARARLWVTSPSGYWTPTSSFPVSCRPSAHPVDSSTSCCPGRCESPSTTGSSASTARSLSVPGSAWRRSAAKLSSRACNFRTTSRISPGRNQMAPDQDDIIFLEVTPQTAARTVVTGVTSDTSSSAMSGR